MAQRYVLLYESADDVLARAPAHFPAHRERLNEFRSRAVLLDVGTFGDPQAEGSMAIFASREAAEEFAQGDPFAREGVVRSWQVRDWDTVDFDAPADSLAKRFALGTNDEALLDEIYDPRSSSTPPGLAGVRADALKGFAGEFSSARS